MIKALREFFDSEKFLEVAPPPLVPCPVIEPHIQVMEVNSHQSKKQLGFLHTSPEFWMKHLLSLGPEFSRIFTIGYCFRDEPNSPYHRNQFLMLEWYRQKSSYEAIAQDLKNLLDHLRSVFPKSSISSEIEILAVEEIFREYLNCPILELSDSRDLKEFIKENYPQVPLPNVEISWEDYFHLLFLNEIEPKLVGRGNLILKEYPAQLRALSKINPDNPKVCERFELFINGVEIANCYSELIDLKEQKEVFKSFNSIRRASYDHEMPEPEMLFNALENGIEESSGIALGVERLTMALMGEENGFWYE